MKNKLLHYTLSIGMWLAFSMLSYSQVLIDNRLKKFEATTTSEGLEILEYVRTIAPYKDGVVYSSRLLQQYASFDEDFEAFSALIDYDYCKVVRRDSVMNIVATWHASDTDSPTKRYRSVTSIWEEGDYIKAYGSGTP